MVNLKRYLFNVLIWLDQGVNTLFLAGDPDETVSSHAAKQAQRGKLWACFLCRLLDKIDKRHCSLNIELDEGKDASA